jgi:uncharacterized membrane protein
MNSARAIALTAVSIALVFVLVFAVKIPVPATGGYWHTGAVAEMFVAMAFGPVVGGIASAVGAALADLVSGYGSFAPLTFIAHGAFGLLAGWLGWRKGWAGMLLGWIIGGLALVALYFLGEATVYGAGAAGAAAEVVPNLIQVGLGIVGLLLFVAVKRAYPQIELMVQRPKFEER